MLPEVGLSGQQKTSEQQCTDYWIRRPGFSCCSLSCCSWYRENWTGRPWYCRSFKSTAPDYPYHWWYRQG